MSAILPIKSKASFEAFRKSGSAFRGKFFVVKIKQNNSSEIGCAFVIKASLGKAVYRNKSRRRIKFLIHQNKEKLLGLDLLFIFRAPVKLLSFCDINKCFGSFLSFLSSNKNLVSSEVSYE
jgi:ribonuclease P protein component